MSTHGRSSTRVTKSLPLGPLGRGTGSTGRGRSGGRAARDAPEPTATAQSDARTPADQSNAPEPMATRRSARIKSGGGGRPAKFQKSSGDAEQSIGQKRKAIDRMEPASKRNKNAEEEDTEDDDEDDEDDGDDNDDDGKKPSVRAQPMTEVRQILDPLIQTVTETLYEFGNFQGSAELKERKASLEELCQKFKNREYLIGHEVLASSFVLPNDGEPQKLVARFQLLEQLRKECMSKARKVPPSRYCKFPAWQRCQAVPEMTIRAGRYKPLPSYPLPLELLHDSFRTFTYWMMYPPKLNPESISTSLESNSTAVPPEAQSSLIQVAQCADILQHNMPQMFDGHDHRLTSFLNALRAAFPDDADHEWCTNVNPMLDGSQPQNSKDSKVDILYRHRITLIPIIYVEVKLELGLGGDPFWQNSRLYRLYTQRTKNACGNGAPVFFIHLTGMPIIHSCFHVLCIYILLQVSTWE